MIDRATVDRIIDAADIVDVVSDFVTLKKRGQNYLGLCPFHNDRRPSFNVSRTKGIYKCFSCGKGGGPINFIMEHEQMSYVEALRYLAKKYHIEIEERELTDEERAAQDIRESLLIINEFAMQFFEDQLANSQEGQEIGMAYFKERGFTAESIKKFHLGYSPENRSALYDAAIKKGYNRQLLFDVGLCIDDGRGGGYDRFRGRVMFPVFNIAGKVIAFGGRTLHNDKAKYVNSPESVIYKKSNELYGLFQAKRAISKEEKCYIVEGYADVISMHQSGFENVIASSGTALTEGHVHKIHRFTENVTELFDGDEAGIHAALRGVDLLLKEGLNIKILLLPQGEDPDSFARSHASHEVKSYIDEHETDFITFKTEMLLKDTARDPIARAKAITDIVHSIALIPEQIARSIYAKECSKRFEIEERVVMAEINKQIAKNKEKAYKERQSKKNSESEDTNHQPDTETDTVINLPPSQIEARQSGGKSKVESISLYRYEEDLMRYVAKYGMCFLCETTMADNSRQPTTVVEYIYNELRADGIELITPVFKRMLNIAMEQVHPFYEALEDKRVVLNQEMNQALKEGIAEIDRKGVDSVEMAEKMEEELKSRIALKMNQREVEFRIKYLEQRLCSERDDQVREKAVNLVVELHQLSRIHSQFGAVIPTEYDRLMTLVPNAILNLKNAIANRRVMEIREQLAHADTNQANELLEEMQQLNEVRKKLAKLTGERVINTI